MFKTPKDGVYVVRNAQAQKVAVDWVRHWLKAIPGTVPPACLWLTALPAADVRQVLAPALATQSPALRGLDVVSTRALQALPEGVERDGVRQLCRALDSMIVLKPGWVILEQAELWFDHGDEPIDKATSLAQMQLLQRWARHAGVSVILPVQGEFAPWCLFADGLVETTPEGLVDFKPWWTTSWGYRSELWGMATADTVEHKLLTLSSFTTLGQAARTLYEWRYHSPVEHPVAIHVQADSSLEPTDASVLLRLGADSVVTGAWSDCLAELGLQAQAMSPATPAGQPLAHYARDVHEVFMPGRLTLLGNREFATQCTMMTSVARRWGLHGVLTRLSLINHVNARTALRLVDFGPAGAVFTATREALYVLKLWDAEPTDEQLDTALRQCFREPLETLFSGHIHLTEASAQLGLLMDVRDELEPVAVDALLNDDEPAKPLAELWADQTQGQGERPWLSRLGAWIGREKMS